MNKNTKKKRKKKEDLPTHVRDNSANTGSKPCIPLQNKLNKIILNKKKTFLIIIGIQRPTKTTHPIKQQPNGMNNEKKNNERKIKKERKRTYHTGRTRLTVSATTCEECPRPACFKIEKGKKKKEDQHEHNKQIR